MRAGCWCWAQRVESNWYGLRVDVNLCWEWWQERKRRRVVGNIIRAFDVVLGVWTILLFNCTVTVTYSRLNHSLHEGISYVRFDLFYSRCIT